MNKKRVMLFFVVLFPCVLTRTMEKPMNKDAQTQTPERREAQTQTPKMSDETVPKSAAHPKK